MNLRRTGNFLLYFGVSIILASLIYMIVNISTADYFINTWIASMGIGVLSTFWGTVSLIINKKNI